MNQKIKLENLYKGNLTWLIDRTIFLTVHGSRAYGINTKDSDTDIKGVCVAPKEYYLGFLNSFEQAEFKEDNIIDPSQSVEGVIYELKKFAKLAVECNPNIIELLFADEVDHIFMKEPFKVLIENRDLFLSKKARYTFAGYAHAQLKRIKGHRSWLLNPPKKFPERKDFGLSETSKISQSQLGAMTSLIQKGQSEFQENVMALYHKEQEYLAAKRHWDQYQNWKTNRNPKRSILEEKYGYDLKHASHLYRLLKMCEEILIDGKVNVKRSDKKEILEIRSGAWSYEDLMEWAEAQEAKMNDLYNQSSLPREPCRKKVDDLVVGIIEKAL